MAAFAAADADSDEVVEFEEFVAAYGLLEAPLVFPKQPAPGPAASGGGGSGSSTPGPSFLRSLLE